MSRFVPSTLLLTLLFSCVKSDAAGRTAADPRGLAQARSEVADTMSFEARRLNMVRRQIERRGIRDTAVLRAMREVPRDQFVPERFVASAYQDRPLPIGYGQTISQPFVVAYMAEAADLTSGERVLEIGTGSGYGAAVLAELAGEVYTVEIVRPLAERAETVLEHLGYRNVHVRVGNGWLGWAEHAPYDAIVVAAAPDELPEPLVDQLVLGGVLVVPIGLSSQTLRVLRKTSRGLEEEASIRVRFVPMVGAPGDSAG